MNLMSDNLWWSVFLAALVNFLFCLLPLVAMTRYVFFKYFPINYSTCALIFKCHHYNLTLMFTALLYL